MKQNFIISVLLQISIHKALINFKHDKFGRTLFYRYYSSEKYRKLQVTRIFSFFKVNDSGVKYVRGFTTPLKKLKVEKDNLVTVPPL